LKPAIFFDRDGTLCREVGYVNHPDRLELQPRCAELVAEVNRRGWAAVVATNQAGVARGYFPAHVLEATQRRLARMLAEQGARLDGLYACVHHPDVGGPGYRQACACRKPGPGMLLQAAAELDLDLSRSYMVGDSFRDVGAGRAAGVRGTVLLRTGYGRGELLWKGPAAGVWPDHVADDLGAALSWIFEQEGQP